MGSMTKDVRKFIYDRLSETAAPPVLEEIMAAFALDRRQAREVVAGIAEAKQVVLLAGTDRILMAHPFSAVATPFRVTRGDGKRYFANCSWDSIAMHVMFDAEIWIDSYCHHCGARIEIELDDGEVVAASPEHTIVYLGLPAAKWWQDVVHACSNTMLFFASTEHLKDWISENAIASPGEALSVQTTIALSRPIYSGKLDLDYQRPGPDALRAHFASLGLTGPFWAI